MRNSIFITILLALAMALSVEAAAPKATITFKANANVQPGSNVILTDIAGIQASKDVSAKIGQIVVAQAPLAGRSRTLDASYIKQRICLAAPKAVIDTAGASSILISGKCTKITTSELMEATKQFAIDRLPKDNCSYEVSIDQISRDIVAPAGADIKVEPELLSSDLHPGLNPVRLVVKADGQAISTTFASVRIKVTASVLVAVENIAAGMPLSAQNTVWDTKDISKYPDAIVNNGNNAYLSMVAHRTIRPGSVISASDAELPLAVKQGDSISLVVKSGNVLLNISAEAKQSGRIGDTIRVSTSVSSSEVRAKITEPGMAEIKG